MYSFEGTSRPVLFEQEDPDYPYWGKGSSFLLANSSNYYWITAKHVIDNMGGSAEKLRIFPADGSQISLPFNEKYLINLDDLDDEDYKDIYVLRIDLSEFDISSDAPLTALDAEAGIMAAEELSENDILWIIGYPSESNSVSYESRSIKNNRSVIRATYAGDSLFQHCHTATINSSIVLSSYDGLSGSPVFFLKSFIKDGQQFKLPLLVGMVLKGTVKSSLVHFVSSSIIEKLILLAEANI